MQEIILIILIILAALLAISFIQPKFKALQFFSKKTSKKTVQPKPSHQPLHETSEKSDEQILSEALDALTQKAERITHTLETVQEQLNI